MSKSIPRCELLTEVQEAVSRLERGQLVAIPTETVYGLACRADDEGAIAGVFTAKGRPSHHPLIIHVAPETNLTGWCEFNETAATLARRFWPGPLTVLLPRGPLASDSITGGRGSVAVRMPSHVMAQEVIHGLHVPIVAPSANSFGHVSPTTALHVIDDLGDRIDAVLDGGPCDIGVESTIIDCTVEPPQILRPGAISRDEIEATLHTSLDESRGEIRAPGMLVNHYSPRCTVHLSNSATQANSLANELRLRGHKVVIIDHSRDIKEYARRLYGDLREAEDSGADDIVAVQPEGTGLAEAVRDRLTRASA